MTEKPATVHTHAAWNTNLDALKAAGVDVNVSADMEDIILSLPEPQYGETVMGDLTQDEKHMFAELKRTKDVLEKLGREYIARSLERFGGTIRHSDVNKPLHEALQSGEQPMTFESDEERRNFFRLDRKAAYLHSVLYWGIAERYGIHDHGIGVRSRFRAVKLQPRG